MLEMGRKTENLLFILTHSLLYAVTTCVSDCVLTGAWDCKVAAGGCPVPTQPSAALLPPPMRDMADTNLAPPGDNHTPSNIVYNHSFHLRMPWTCLLLSTHFLIPLGLDTEQSGHISYCQHCVVGKGSSGQWEETQGERRGNIPVYYLPPI